MDDVTAEDLPDTPVEESLERSLLRRVFASMRHELFCYDPRLHDEIKAVVKQK